MMLPLLSGSKNAVAAFRFQRAQALLRKAHQAISAGDPRALQSALQDKSLFTPESLLTLADAACRAPSQSEPLLRELFDAGMPPAGSFPTGAGPRVPLQACLLAGNWESAALTALALPMTQLPALHALEWLLLGLRERAPHTVAERQCVYNFTSVLLRMAPEGKPLADEALRFAGVSFDADGSPRFSAIDPMAKIETLRSAFASRAPLAPNLAPSAPSLPPPAFSSPPPSARRILASMAPPRANLAPPPAPIPSIDALSSRPLPPEPAPQPPRPSASPSSRPEKLSVRQRLKRGLF